MGNNGYNGLVGGRLDPDYYGNYSVLAMIEAGMTVRTVAEHCGLTPSQVMYRYRKAGLSPMDYRRGHGPTAEMIIEKFDVDNISSSTVNNIKRQYQEVYL